MNLANKITVSRILLIPVFVISFELLEPGHLLPLILFIVASLTDFLDGYIARSKNQITTFGVFLDPLVDKMLTQAAFILLAGAGIIPAWTVIVIVCRELLITGFRIVAASENVNIAASKFGKYKTTTQFLSIIVFLAPTGVPHRDLIGFILLYVCVFLTVWSGADYLWKNREVLNLDDI